MKTALLCLASAVVLALGCSGPEMNVTDDGGSLTLRRGKDTILVYNYAVTPAPAGARGVYARSGYIHPACTPSGFVFTRIQPEDHLHHYGIWNPWTHIDYQGKIYDLWNLRDSLGTVRARSVETVVEGRRTCGFDAALDHVVYAPEGETVVISETWRVRAHDCKDAYVWDFESEQVPLKDIVLRKYRYQGLCCRGTGLWNKDNVDIVSSEGLGRDEIDGTTARWIYCNGDTDKPGGRAGFMFLSHPRNFNHPEPLRIWDSGQNRGNGDVFINFSPPKTRDWPMEAGKKYTLRYRVVAYDGDMSPERAEAFWSDYAR